MDRLPLGGVTMSDLDGLKIKLDAEREKYRSFRELVFAIAVCGLNEKMSPDSILEAQPIISALMRLRDVARGV